MHIASAQQKEISKVCKQHKVKSLFAFGSVTRDDFNDNSDIDLVVDFDENDPFLYADLYFDLKAQLEKIFHRNIDLLEDRGIKNLLFKKHLDQTKVKLYGH